MGVNDIMMAVQYEYTEQQPLTIPIISFDGTKDLTISRGYMSQWKNYTKGRYRNVPVHGDHYFVSTHYKEVTGEVGRECISLIDGLRGGIMGAHSWVGLVDGDEGVRKEEGGVENGERGNGGVDDGENWGGGRGRVTMAAATSVLMMLLLLFYTFMMHNNN
jgi:hypothetical protein